MTGKPDPVAAAKATLADLTDERERVDGRLADIGAEREKIAHAALTGDMAAREQLDALKREAAELADHRKDVEAAIAQAERDVAKAEAVVLRHREVAEANRRKAYAAYLRSVGAAADQGKLAALAVIPQESAAAGIDFLTLEFIRGKLIDVVQWVFLRPLQHFMHPIERHLAKPECSSVSELLGKWADRIDQEADRVIAGKSEPKKEAA